MEYIYLSRELRKLYPSIYGKEHFISRHIGGREIRIVAVEMRSLLQDHKESFYDLFISSASVVNINLCIDEMSWSS